MLRIIFRIALYAPTPDRWVASHLRVNIRGEGTSRISALQNFAEALRFEYQEAKKLDRPLFEGCSLSPAFQAWWSDQNPIRVSTQGLIQTIWTYPKAIEKMLPKEATRIEIKDVGSNPTFSVHG